MKMMTNVMLLLATIAIPSMAKIMVLDDVTDLRALLSAQADVLSTEHKAVVNNIASHKWNIDQAMGIARGNGPLWSVVCQNTPRGNIPCRVDSNGTAYYSWGGSEVRWGNVSAPISGKLYWNDAQLPSGCKTRGHQNNDNQDYYAAVLHTINGTLPGKANSSLTEAWYSWGGKEVSVRKRFQIIC